MDFLGRIRKAYLLSMALQHVDQIHLNMHQYLQGIRRRRRRQRRRLWQQPWVSRRKQFGLYDELLVELRQEDQSSFRNFMRMPVEMYDEVLQRIQHRVSKQYTWLREPLEPGLKLAATLRHLAAGSTYADMKFSRRVPGNTLSVVVREVCSAIIDEYTDEVITPPNDQEEWKAIDDQLLLRWHFPHCCGALDGKHIAIKKPAGSGSLYHNYKGFFSIVMLALVDGYYKFIWADVGG